MASKSPYLEYANGVVSQILGWTVTVLFVASLLGLASAAFLILL